MFNMARQRSFLALTLMLLLFVGFAVAAEAKDTKGADRLVKGAVIGAAAGTVTQMVRGRTQGKELAKGAVVGGAVGAAVGGYSDYRQERREREKAERRAGYYDRSYRDSRYARPAYDWRSDYRNGRGRRHGRR